MIVRISGNAPVRRPQGDRLTTAIIQQLDGAESKEACSDYLEAEFADIGITGGTVKLRQGAAGTFRVVTEFTSPVVLHPDQLKRLVLDTLGQWSDGIGEGCFDELMERLGVSIDLASNREGDVLVEQIDDGNVVPPPNTALAIAARDGDLINVIRLLDSGANSEVRVQGYTPLQLAVLGGHADVSLELIRRGADVRASDPMGQDPLMLTALSNRITDGDAFRIARALLEAGVNPNGPRGAYTPLYVAEIRSKAALAAVLRQRGALQ